jgi:hypothetical protein
MGNDATAMTLQSIHELYNNGGQQHDGHGTKEHS